MPVSRLMSWKLKRCKGRGRKGRCDWVCKVHIVKVLGIAIQPIGIAVQNRSVGSPSCVKKRGIAFTAKSIKRSEKGAGFSQRLGNNTYEWRIRHPIQYLVRSTTLLNIVGMQTNFVNTSFASGHFCSSSGLIYLSLPISSNMKDLPTPIAPQTAGSWHPCVFLSPMAATFFTCSWSWNYWARVPNACSRLLGEIQTQFMAHRGERTAICPQKCNMLLGSGTTRGAK
jgi:hypothetical protein